MQGRDRRRVFFPLSLSHRNSLQLFCQVGFQAVPSSRPDIIDVFRIDLFILFFALLPHRSPGIWRFFFFSWSQTNFRLEKLTNRCSRPAPRWNFWLLWERLGFTISNIIVRSCLIIGWWIEGEESYFWWNMRKHIQYQHIQKFIKLIVIC